VSAINGTSSTGLHQVVNINLQSTAWTEGVCKTQRPTIPEFSKQLRPTSQRNSVIHHNKNLKNNPLTVTNSCFVNRFTLQQCNPEHAQPRVAPKLIGTNLTSSTAVLPTSPMTDDSLCCRIIKFRIVNGEFITTKKSLNYKIWQQSRVLCAL
jgi:hypothetical protein